MPLLKAKEIIGSSVYSRSDIFLGKVIDLEIELESHSVRSYLVHGDLLDFFKEPLVIGANQIVEIKKDRIIVEDTVIPGSVEEKEVAPA